MHARLSARRRVLVVGTVTAVLGAGALLALVINSPSAAAGPFDTGVLSPDERRVEASILFPDGVTVGPGFPNYPTGFATLLDPGTMNGAWAYAIKLDVPFNTGFTLGGVTDPFTGLTPDFDVCFYSEASDPTELATMFANGDANCYMAEGSEAGAILSPHRDWAVVSLFAAPGPEMAEMGSPAVTPSRFIFTVDAGSLSLPASTAPPVDPADLLVDCVAELQRVLLGNEHDAIDIADEEDLSSPLAADGQCPGDSHDWVIQDWTVTADQEADATIQIADITSSLLLRDLTVNGPSQGVDVWVRDVGEIAFQGITDPAAEPGSWSITGADDLHISDSNMGDLLIEDVQTVRLEEVTAGHVVLRNVATAIVSEGAFSRLTLDGVDDIEVVDTNIDGSWGAGPLVDVTASNVIFQTTHFASGNATAGLLVRDDAVADVQASTFAITKTGSPCIVVEGTTLYVDDVLVRPGECDSGFLDSTGASDLVLGGLDLDLARTEEVAAVSVQGGTLLVKPGSITGAGYAFQLEGMESQNLTWEIERFAFFDQQDASLHLGPHLEAAAITLATFGGGPAPLAAAYGAPPDAADRPRLIVYDSVVNEGRDAFGGPTGGSFDDHFDLWLHVDPRNGTNVRGGPQIAGNHWTAYPGWDSDGDGLGQQPFAPTGTERVDRYPLVPANHAPSLAINITPDPGNLTAVYHPGDLFFFNGTTSDVDQPGAPPGVVWDFGDGDPVAGDTAFSFSTPGDHPVRATAQDDGGAIVEIVRIITIDAPNQAPVIEDGPELRDCDDPDGPPLDPDTGIILGAAACLFIAATDPDAASGADGLDRDALVVLDVDRNGITDVGDMRLSHGGALLVPGEVGATSQDLETALLPAGPVAVGSTPGGAVILDLDGDGNVSSGDVRLWDARAPDGSRVRAADHDAGTPLDLVIESDGEDGDGLPIARLGNATFLDLDGNGLATPGDLELSPRSPLLVSDARVGLAYTPDSAPVGFVDLKGTFRIKWDLRIDNSPQGTAAGDEAVFTPDRSGLATARIFIRDLGAPSQVLETNYLFQVQSPDSPLPAATAAPVIREYVEGGLPVLETRRLTELTLTDVSSPAAGTSITDSAWRLCPPGPGPCMDLTGSPVLTPPLEQRGDHILTLTTSATNGQHATTDVVVRVLRALPEARLDYTPLLADAETELTFSADGSLDLGDGVDPVPTDAGFALDMDGDSELGPGDLLLLDRSGDGVLSPDDLLYAQVTSAHPPGRVAADHMDLGSSLDGSLMEVCHWDGDGDGQLSDADGIYLQADACGTVGSESYRAVGIGIFVGGEFVGDGGDLGRPTQTLSQAPPTALILAGDHWTLDLDGDDKRGPLDVPLEGPLAFQLLPTTTEAQNATENATLAALRTPADATGLYLSTTDQVDADDLRLARVVISLPGLAPLPDGLGMGLPLDPDRRLQVAWCFADLDGSGTYGLDDVGNPEPVFLAAQCDAVAPGAARFQPDRFGGHLGPATQVRPGDADDGLGGDENGTALLPLSSAAVAVAGDRVYLDLDGTGQVDAHDIRLLDLPELGRPVATRVVAASHADQGGALTYQWTCSAGCLPDETPFAHPTSPVTKAQFQTSGAKSVRLEVIDDDLNTAVATNHLVLDNLPPVPVIQILDAHPTSLDMVRFSAAASWDPDGLPGGLGLTYTWDFGDGSPVARGPEVSHRFPARGVYNVTLLVRDADPNKPLSSSTSVPVEVFNAPPVAALLVQPDFPMSLQGVLFDGTPSVDLDGNIASWKWTFYQGGTELATQFGDKVQRSFPTPGDYKVELLVRDDAGDEDLLTRSFTIGNRPPTAEAAASHQARLPPALFKFSAAGSEDPEGAPLTCTWDFDDGAQRVTDCTGALDTCPTGETGAVVCHTYTLRGLYNVTLTVTDAHGAQDTTFVLVRVLNQPPLLGVHVPTTGKVHEPVTFLAQVSDDEGDDVRVDWTFTHSSGAPVLERTGDEVDVAFTQWGTYKVHAEAFDSGGDSRTLARSIKISSQQPEATLTASATEVAIGQAVSFAGDATDPDGVITSHFLDFGDGTTLFASEAEHVYRAPGEYQVRYRATDESQASGTASVTIKVINPPPQLSEISVTVDDPRTGDLLLYSIPVEDENPDQLEYLWDFKDGVVSSTATPTHIYRVPGTFLVEVTVTDAFGAKAKASRLITVAEPFDTDATGDEGETPAPKGNPPAERISQDAPAPGVAFALAALGLLLAWRRRSP